MNYLLDTNICIALMNGTPRRVRERYGVVVRGGSRLTTSSIVAHELWYGVANSELVERNARKLSGFLSRELTTLDFSQEDAQAAAEIRAKLESKGQRICEYDTLIAGQAFSRNLILVTANTREFERVKGLIVEDWTL